MKLLLTGVTGVGMYLPSNYIRSTPLTQSLFFICTVRHAAGLAVYRRAIEDPDVTHITLLTRRAVPEWAVLPPNATLKTTTIIHSDFTTYPPELAARLAENDACVWALGRSSMGMSEEEYTTTTYTSVMNAARALRDAGVGEGRPADKPFRFVYISGEHADPEGKSRQMWARVKVLQFPVASTLVQSRADFLMNRVEQRRS